MQLPQGILGALSDRDGITLEVTFLLLPNPVHDDVNPASPTKKQIMVQVSISALFQLLTTVKCSSLHLLCLEQFSNSLNRC